LLPTEQILVLHWAVLASILTFSLGMCILFYLGAELMTTSPTSSRCRDTHSSPAMTLTCLYIVGHIFATASNQLNLLHHRIYRWSTEYKKE